LLLLGFLLLLGLLGLTAASPLISSTATAGTHCEKQERRHQQHR
jgi:hypothetical protein